MELEKIKNVCENKNWHSRKYQYEILSELTGVSPAVCKQICSLQRVIRMAIPKDSVGEREELKWHKPHYIHTFECTANNQYKLIS